MLNAPGQLCVSEPNVLCTSWQYKAWTTKLHTSNQPMSPIASTKALIKASKHSILTCHRNWRRVMSCEPNCSLAGMIDKKYAPNAIIVVYCVITGYTTTLMDLVTCVWDVYRVYRSLRWPTPIWFHLYLMVLDISTHSHTLQRQYHGTGVDPWCRSSPWTYRTPATLSCLQ